MVKILGVGPMCFVLPQCFALKEEPTLHIIMLSKAFVEL